MIKKIISLLFVLSMVLFSQNAKNIFDAINNNDLSSVKKIIASGGNVNAINKSGMTALIVASEKGNIEIVRELINAGANVNGTNSVGWTALMGASFEGNAEVVKELINSGANINAFGIKYKNTALMQAIRGENPEIVKILVDSGADINMKNANGETAYDKAMEVGLTEVAELLRIKPSSYSSYTGRLSTNTKVIIMIIIVLIMAIVVNWLTRFNNSYEAEELSIKLWTWCPLLFSIIYIFTSIDFIDGVFEDIVFLLWAIGNCIQYITYNSYMASKYDIVNNTAYNVTEFIKWLALATGLFIALTGGGMFIKVLFVLGMILGIVILIVIAALGILCSGADAVGQMVVTTYRVAKPIVKEAIKLINATLESIADYFNEYLADEYPTANYLIVNKVKHELKAGNYNAINIGIYDDENDLLGNETITCESIGSDLREGQEIYI